MVKEKKIDFSNSKNSKNFGALKIINFQKIEKKWQSEWEKKKIFEVKEDKKKKKFYVLEMYPYPSASYLHMGHVRNYTIGDIFARFKRMNGYNVLYPMGYDSFGLPAETAAKKEKVHPEEYTKKAIQQIMKYQKALGNSYDWSRVIASHEPNYYKWNQYFFLKFYEKGLVYRKKAPVNWCKKCESVLANEESEGGKCWRCGEEVITKDLDQWFLKITAYADELLKGLDKINWFDRIKTMQKNWIGKSKGTEINFQINDEKWPIFTTRPDTIYGVTFMVISLQHPRLMELVTKENKKEIDKLLKKIKSTKQEDIDALEKEGAFTGSYAIHPLTKEKVPIYAGNFVLADYGCGMVMAVPAHDQRDFEFAKKYNIPIKVVIQPNAFELNAKKMSRAYISEGKLVESKEFNGQSNKEAISEITKYLEKKKLGKETINYKIRDWLISRQRYWGTPIPMIHCNKCGVVAVPEKELPVLLPKNVNFNAKENPLLSSKEFVNVKCPICKQSAKRETDTMGGFFDSSWYFLRFCSPNEKNKPFDKQAVKYWMPVDQYIGGAEHAVMHLIYARFFTKALRDLGFIDIDEPFQNLFNQGIVYKDGAKMSKSKGNVVYQTDISDKYGIDTARLFLMTVASPEKQMEWSDKGVQGSFRVINKLIECSKKIKNSKNDKKTDSKMNSLIKQSTESLSNFEYPKSIISSVKFLDYLNELEIISKQSFENLLKLLHPFCPHITEELWHNLGNKNFISLEKWPIADEKKIDAKLEKEEEQIDNLIADIRNILRILENKGEKKQKIKIFVIPNELELYIQAKDKIKKNFDMIVEILSIKEAKQEGKIVKAKPGKPGILLE